jgi:molybdate transport system permease protein
MSLEPLWLSLRYAGLATLCSIPPAVLLAYILARREFPGRDLLDAAANLPLALPPAVLVYYLLSALRRWPLAFSWRRAVALSTIYTLPLLMRMSRAALAAVDHSFENAARGLGASEWRVFWRITAPLAWRGLLAAILAGLARAVADFALTAIVAIRSRDASRDNAQTAALLLLIGAAVLAAFYAGNRLQRGRAPA